MFKKNMFTFFLICISIFFSSSLASGKFYYKNKDYFNHKNRNNILFLDKSEKIKIDKYAMDIVESWKLNAEEVEDSMSSVFELVYKKYAKNYITNIKVIDTKDYINDSIRYEDRNNYKILNLYKDTIHREIIVPYRNYLVDTNEITFNYAMHIGPIKIKQSQCGAIIPIPTPIGLGVIVSPSQCLILKGTYYIWDYENQKVICAGDFERQLVYKTMLTKRKALIDFFKPLIVEIFNGTPYRLSVQVN
jgi:hypothetical protein